MEYLREALGPDPPKDLRAALEKRLENLSEPEQLDTVTRILMSGITADENLGELIFAAWEYLCEQHLWLYKFESLEQYRQLISYRDTVKPIIKRFKKSERIKVASMGTIAKHWQTSIDQAIPEHLAPPHWSKHLSFLLSSLSKYKSRDDAIALLEESIHNRPTRSRQRPDLMASDVERVLKNLSISNQSTTYVSDESSTPPIGRTQSPQSAGETPTSSELSAHASSKLQIAANSSPQSILLSSCKCSSICFPLVVLLDGLLERIEEDLGMDLIRWAHDVSWSNTCLFHLQRLGSLKLGSCAMFLSHDEILGRLDELYSFSAWACDQPHTTVRSIDGGGTHSMELFGSLDFANPFPS